MTALPLEVRSTTAAAALEPVSPSSGHDPLQAAAGRVIATRFHTLDLSRSRTYDATLDILKAYKLSGNFHCNLEIVLKHMGHHDVVTYRVEPHPMFDFPDCRHVVFKARDNVPGDRFDAIVRSIKDRIGFHIPWWARLLRRLALKSSGHIDRRVDGRRQAWRAFQARDRLSRHL